MLLALSPALRHFRPQVITTYKGHTESVEAVGFSKRCVRAGPSLPIYLAFLGVLSLNLCATGSMDGKIQIWYRLPSATAAAARLSVFAARCAGT